MCPLRLSIITLVEAGFLLLRFYGISRELVVDTLVRLRQRDNVTVREVDTALAIDALPLCRPSGRVSFADALLGPPREPPSLRVWTFDQHFPVTGIVVREP